jgi:hypothetical protein
MAFLTVRTEHPNVENRILVASHTLSRKSGKLTTCMAILAEYINMRTGQREIAQIVIEGSLIPIEGSMASGTVRAKAAIMLIVLAMA